MFKRIMITFLVLMMIYSSIVIGYRLNEPDIILNPSDSFSDNALDYETLTNYTLSTPNQKHYYFFCTSTSSDCTYVANSVLSDASSTSGVDLYSLLEFVDITNLEQTDHAAVDLKNNWGITSWPAFLAVHVENGNINVDSRLEWDPSSPISSANLQQWLRQNGLIDQGDAIETPLS